MLRIIALLAVLIASPAYAINELKGQPFSEVVESGQRNGVIIEKLNASDTATLDESLPNRPQPSVIYLLTLGTSAIIVLENEGEVIFSSNPVNLEVINKALHRTGA